MPEFGVLGPVRAANGTAIAVLPPKERIVLATLLLRAGQAASISTLIEALWDDEPPVTARNGLQGHVKQLRRLLGPAGERIITRTPGYLIEVRPGELDLDSFIRLTGSARSAAKAGAWEDAVTLLNEALGLWRGEPLSDIPSLLLQRNETPRLAELRAQALDARIDAELRSGKHDAVTAELRHLVAAHPHRERSWAQLMLALYLGGRQSEAVAVYRQARTVLREDLGIDPGSELQELHHRILTADSALTKDMAGSRIAPEPAAAPLPVPRQLPADLRDFTGRDADISELARFLAAQENRPGAVPVAAIAGPGGIGKTALAVHVAHQVAARFTGGQLFVNLGGAVSPVRAADILATFLRDLGVPDAAIPPTEAERAARYRTILASRKTLIVLDGAHSAAQVRPLLPGSGGSAVIVTSRAMLTDLAGAAIVTLDVLDAHASRTLFSLIVGHERAAADPAGTDGVLESCAGLPLAIRIAGNGLAAEWVASRAGVHAATRPGDADGYPLGSVPAQLPADTADFTGRAAQVELLCGVLAAEPADGRAGAVVISAVAGMGGIGKTALAVHAAHRLRDRYPDGQLFACLQGATCPLSPAEVLARFLRDLGVPDAAIPAGEAERAARYRTLLAGRRVLIVLDDARDAAQVRPLLPGTAGCAVLVTSRSTLPGLPGTALLNLGVLDQSEAGDLFGAIIGTDRAAAEPDATAAVLACCAGLPLAVRIIASRLASRPHWSIAHLAARLAVEQDRLAELAAGDLAVRASFAVSYDALPAGQPDPARVFRLLGLADLAVVSLPAVAALAGRPAGEVAAALEILTDAHLLESPAVERFRLHDLLRSYAAELAGQTDSAQDRNAALHRMLGWYGEQAVTAARILAPGRLLPTTVAVPAAAPAAMAGLAQALDWYETERASLLAAARRAAALGRHDVAAQIAVAMWDFFQRTPYADDWLAISQIGVSSARQLGDDAVLGWLLNALGQVHGPQRKFADSRRYLSESLEIRQRTGDRHGEASVLNSLAVDLFYQERFEDALEYLRAALAIYTDLGEQPDAAIILNNMGHGLLCLKRHDEALDHLGQALMIQQEIGARHAEGITQTTIAQVNLDLGRFEAAVEHYRRARAALLDESIRDHLDQADILCGLGTALAALGRAGEAREAWLAAIPILDGAADPRAAELTARLAGPGLVLAAR